MRWRSVCRTCYNGRRRDTYKRRGASEREAARLAEALRRERAGLPRREQRQSVVDRTAPREDARSFVAWLRAYQCAARIDSAEALARELGLVERRVRALLAGEQRFVSSDVVSRALTDARIVVSVGGRLVVTYDDLYPLPD